jgi:hypothetical protein
MIGKIVAASIVLATLSGCLAFVPIQTLDKTGIEVVLAAAKMPIVSVEVAKGMTDLGEVVGHSCMNQAVDPSASQVGAIDQTKIVAVQLGGTAIASPVCEEGGVSLVKNCWHSWECKTRALR